MVSDTFPSLSITYFEDSSQSVSRSPHSVNKVPVLYRKSNHGIGTLHVVFNRNSEDLHASHTQMVDLDINNSNGFRYNSGKSQWTVNRHGNRHLRRFEFDKSNINTIYCPILFIRGVL